MPQISQKGFAHILFLLLVLAGIAAGVYLVQHPQIFKPKASDNLPYYAHGQYESTPIADIYKFPKPANGVRVAINFDFVDGSLDKFGDFLSKEIDYLWINIGGQYGGLYPASLADYGKLWDVIGRLKALNPQMKIGLYTGGVVSPDSIYPPYMILSDGDILHRNDGSPIITTPDNRNIKIINVTSAATMSKVADLWKEIFTTYNVDGVLMDSFEPNYYARWLRNDLKADGCREGGCNSVEFWESHLAAFTQTLTNVNAPLGKDVYSNGLFQSSNSSFMGTYNVNIANYNSGVLAEHVHRIYSDLNQFKTYMEAANIVVQKGKQVFFWFQPQLYKFTDPSVSYTNDLNLERFYLGSYLLIHKNPYTFFGYHPGQEYRAYDEVGNPEIFFYRDWNLDFGQPLENYKVEGSDLFIRAYENGIIVVNPTSNAQGYGLSPGQKYKLWEPCSGEDIEGSISVPAKSGNFYFYAGKGCSAEPTLVPTPVATAEVTASPTPMPITDAASPIPLVSATPSSSLSSPSPSPSPTSSPSPVPKAAIFERTPLPIATPTPSATTAVVNSSPRSVAVTATAIPIATARPVQKAVAPTTQQYAQELITRPPLNKIEGEISRPANIQQENALFNFFARINSGIFNFVDKIFN